MAIFGNLSDMGLLDLIPLLAHQNGRLVLIHKNGNLDIYLSGRRIVCAQEDRRVLSPSQLEERLFALVEQEDGSFEFFRDERPKHQRGCISIPVDELMLKLVTLKDELESVRANLPLPDTVFALANVAVAYSEPELAEFLDRAWPHLTEGASARSLARALGLPLERVRYLLYKLRTLGAIQPKAQKTETTGERRGLAGRLLGMLKRRFRNLSWSL